jgi:hypothetical protein
MACAASRHGFSSINGYLESRGVSQGSLGDQGLHKEIALAAAEELADTYQEYAECREDPGLRRDGVERWWPRCVSLRRFEFPLPPSPLHVLVFPSLSPLSTVRRSIYARDGSIYARDVSIHRCVVDLFVDVRIFIFFFSLTPRCECPARVGCDNALSRSISSKKGFPRAHARTHARAHSSPFSSHEPTIHWKTLNPKNVVCLTPRTFLILVLTPKP